MKPVVTASEMKAMDQNTIQKKQVPSLLLMERAAWETVRRMEEHYRNTPEHAGRILVLCGGGNNGADGVAIARMLAAKGYRAEYYLAGNPDHFTEELNIQLKIAENYRVIRENIPDFEAYTTIVDALFGVGLSREVRGSYAVLLEKLDKAPAWKVAVDVPSGINASLGSVLGNSYQADMTVTFAYRKAGLCLYPGRTLAGEIQVADVGIYMEPGDSPGYHLEKEDLKELPVRCPEGNKGTFGKVLVVAGSEGMSGAAYFAAASVLASGAGMVRIHTVKENRVILQTLLPEAIVSAGELESEYQNAFDWCDALVIGPGLGTSVKAAIKAGWFLWKAAEYGKRVVLDADGLNLLSGNPAWKEYLSERCILTPHMGEMSRLMGKPVEELKRDPVFYARECAAMYGAVCVLKDACTVVVSPRGETYYNLTGNAGMATPGSGDVLSGILGAFSILFELGDERFNPGKEAAMGVFVHGLCGEKASRKKGIRSVAARDIIEAIPDILRECE